MGGKGSGRKKGIGGTFTPIRANVIDIGGRPLEMPDYSGVAKHPKTLAAFDERYVNVTGDTMTGDLTVPNLNVTTDLDVGLWQDDNDGTYDADGLLTAAQLTQTVIGTLVRTTGTGAVVNGVPLTEACQVYITPTVDDLLTGKAKLTVKYASKAAEAALY